VIFATNISFLTAKIGLPEMLKTKHWSTAWALRVCQVGRGESFNPRGRTGQEVNEPGGESSKTKGRISQGANKSGSEQARGKSASGQKGQGVKWQRGEKARPHPILNFIFFKPKSM